VKKETHDSLCLLGLLLSRIYGATGWSDRGESVQEAIKDVLSALEDARSMVKDLTHEIGRSIAVRMLMLLNKLDEGLTQVKLEIEYLADSEVAPETIERVDRHAEWAIDAIEQKYREVLCRYEEHVFAVAQAGIEGDE
jgi:hypothetical protein